MEKYLFRIDTQFLENYGSHSEPVRSYWKFKGGDTYIVTSHSNRIADAVAFLVDYLHADGLSHHMRELPIYWEPLPEGWEDWDNIPPHRTYITVPPEKK